MRPAGAGSRRVMAALALVPTLALATACSTAPPSQPAAAPTPGEDPLARYYDQTLEWGDCGEHVQCAELTVPRDYGDPHAADIEIAVARYSTGGHDRTPLVYNPGGPGGSGVEFARFAPYVVSDRVLAGYDLVGFDPRGVGGSEPVECATSEQIDHYIAADITPDDRRDVTRIEADARRFARGCQRGSRDMLANIDSTSVVRDMDILRAALGQPRLDFLGSSYGTKLGARYAGMFRSTVGRMVLDGVLPPDLTAAEVTAGQAIGFEDSLRRFVADCQQDTDCPVAGDSVDAGIDRIQEWLADLEYDPVPLPDGRTFTQGLALQAVIYHLYYPYSGDWELLSKGLTEAFAGDPRALVATLDQRLERDQSGEYANNGNSYEAFVAITCLDLQGESDPAALAERAEDLAREAPTFGPALVWSELTCGRWPIDSPAVPATDAGTDVGMLIVSATHDPATPYVWAQLLRDRHPNARLVSWEADGHTAYSNGSTCVDEAVDTFLVDGVLPEQDLTCGD